MTFLLFAVFYFVCYLVLCIKKENKQKESSLNDSSTWFNVAQNHVLLYLEYMEAVVDLG